MGALNASLIVDSQYGRSVAAENLFYVLPDETIYNFEAFARSLEYILLLESNLFCKHAILNRDFKYKFK